MKLFNALTHFVNENKFGVQGTTLEDFREFLVLFSSLLSDIGPHARKLREQGWMKLQKRIEELLKFYDPKAHVHSPISIKIEHLKSKVSLLVLKLERKDMNQRHMKSFSVMVLKAETN